MRIGIVGFASSGKSTLFQILTGAKPDHSTGRSGQLGIAEIRDPRLGALTSMYKPAKTTAATLELLDTPGLDPRGGGDNAAVLGLMRQVDGLVIVLGQYLGGDPADELRRLSDELLFADLALVTGRSEKLEAGMKKPRPEAEREAHAQELNGLRQLAAHLEAGGPLAERTPAERASFHAYQLFMDKPRVVIVNQAEPDLGKPILRGPAAPHLAPLALSAKLELELGQLEPAESQAFLAELGLESLARDSVVDALARGAMGQISFFTVG